MDDLRPIVERLTKLETRMDAMADRSWVHELLSPIKDNLSEIRHSMETMTGEMKALFKTQDELLKEKAEREKERHEAEMKALRENTLWHILKERWAPILGFIIAVSTLLRLVDPMVSSYVQHIVKP